MPNFFKANLALLQEHQPQAAAIMADLDEPLGEVVTAANGKLTLTVRNSQGQQSFLHLPDAPEAEVPQFLALVPEGASDIVILCGMGLGYTPLALISERPEISHLIIFELEPRIFLQAMQHMDLSPLLQDPRLILSLSPQPDPAKTLAAAHHALQYENICLLKHLPSVALHEAAYQALEEGIDSFANGVAAMGATKAQHGETIMANRFRNLSAMRHHFLLENLKGLFQDIPAFIVAAGPSLDKNINLLQEAHDKAVIITVDSSLPALLFHGITPHFISAIDFSKFTFEKIATSGLKVKDTSLICSYWVGPNAPKRFPANNVFWAATSHPLEKWVHQQLGGAETTPSIGTVAHLNLISAITMGCKPIIFVGQDLSYPPPDDHHRHVDHARHCYFGNTEERNAKKNALWVEGLDGTMRPTLRDFLVYKKIFEEIIAANPGHYINATAEGAHLVGTEVLPLAEVIQTYCAERQPIPELLRARLAKTPPPAVMTLAKAFDTTGKQIDTVQKNLQECIRLATAFRSGCRRLEQQQVALNAFAELPVALQHKALRLDALREAIDQAEPLWQFTDELTMKGFRYNAQKTRLINQLQASADKFVQFLLHNVELILHTATVRKQALHTFGTYLSQGAHHWRQEEKMLSALQRADKREKALFTLARAYLATDDVCLAKPLLTELQSRDQQNPEINFYLACIAAYQTDHRLANTLFDQAEQLDTGYKKRIAKFRQQYGDEYRAISEEFKAAVGHPSKQMLQRGLSLSPQHPAICRDLAEMTAADQENDTTTSVVTTITGTPLCPAR